MPPTPCPLSLLPIVHILPLLPQLLLLPIVQPIPPPSKTASISACPEDEFHCPNSHTCIPSIWTCDKEQDCVDGADESPELCNKRKCSGDEWSCRNPGLLQCVPLSWVCDNKRDCEDGSDESVCTTTCLQEEFTCENGLCIQPMWRCDGEDDCGDRSDERDCQPRSCVRGQVKCRDGTCIKTRHVCDGSADCPDGEDELGCDPEQSRNSSSSCGQEEYTCRDRHYCVHKAWLCDGERDCPDGSDEDSQLCQHRTQQPGDTGGEEKSDGTQQPGEPMGESANKTHCEEHQHPCDHGRCVADPVLCTEDGPGAVIDLEEEEEGGQADEDDRGGCNNVMEALRPALCGVDECQINNGGCEQICRDKPLGRDCGCRPGYSLVADGSCEDINECEQVGICSQLCHNKLGGHKCTCLQGYRKDPQDSSRCKATEGHPSLLFTHKTDVRKLSLDRPAMTPIVNSTRSSCALDYNFKTGMVFWSDIMEEAIYSAHIDEGQHKTVVIAEGVVTADGLAVDWVHSHLYWTDTGTNSISVCDFTGLSQAVLVQGGLQEPRAIVLHPGKGWMFWSDWGREPRIERAGMDGSLREVIVEERVRWPNGLTLDLTLDRLYWVDAKLATVGSCALDGSQARTVLTSHKVLRHPFSISVFEDLLYWTEWDTHSVYRANKFTGENITAVTQTGLAELPMVVVVYHPYRQPDYTNYCLPFNGHCSHFCLPAPRLQPSSPKTACSCPVQLVMHHDNRTCLPAPQPDAGPPTPASPLARTPVSGPPGPGAPLLCGLTTVLLVGGLLVWKIYQRERAKFSLYRLHTGGSKETVRSGSVYETGSSGSLESVQRTILTLSSSSSYVSNSPESQGLIIRGPLIDLN